MRDWLNSTKDLHESLRKGACKWSRFFHKQATQAIIPLIEQSFLDRLKEVIFSGRVIESNSMGSGPDGAPRQAYLIFQWDDLDCLIRIPHASGRLFASQGESRGVKVFLIG